MALEVLKCQTLTLSITNRFFLSMDNSICMANFSLSSIIPELDEHQIQSWPLKFFGRRDQFVELLPHVCLLKYFCPAFLPHGDPEWLKVLFSHLLFYHQNYNPGKCVGLRKENGTKNTQRISGRSGELSLAFQVPSEGCQADNWGGGWGLGTGHAASCTP